MDYGLLNRGLSRYIFLKANNAIIPKYAINIINPYSLIVSNIKLIKIAGKNIAGANKDPVDCGHHKQYIGKDGKCSG